LQEIVSSHKKLNKIFQPRMHICKDKNGTVIGDGSEILNRWAEYVEETRDIKHSAYQG
jgi:hypothetical protein